MPARGVCGDPLDEGDEVGGLLDLDPASTVDELPDVCEAGYEDRHPVSPSENSVREFVADHADRSEATVLLPMFHRDVGGREHTRHHLPRPFAAESQMVRHGQIKPLHLEQTVGSPNEGREQRVADGVGETRPGRDAGSGHFAIPFKGLSHRLGLAREHQREGDGEIEKDAEGSGHCSSMERGEQKSEHSIIAHSANKINTTTNISRIMNGEWNILPQQPQVPINN